MTNKIAFLFSGQGAQYPGMMKDIYDNSAKARSAFDIAGQQLNRSISNLCFNGTEEELNLTHNTQPCMLTAEIAAYEAIVEAGIKPDAVAGFSLGEYAALVAANVLTFEDVIKIIQVRADAMQEAVPVGKGGMAAVKSDKRELIKELCESCKDYVEIVNYNSPKQVAVSGTAEGVNEFVGKALENSLVAKPLPVSAPFHSKLMEPASEILENEFEKYTFSDATIPLYMNVDAQIEIDCASIKCKLVEQAKSPVLWEQTIYEMYKDGINTFIEVGPGNMLYKFAKKTIKGVNLYNIETMEDIEEVISEIRG